MHTHMHTMIHAFICKYSYIHIYKSKQATSTHIQTYMHMHIQTSLHVLSVNTQTHITLVIVTINVI